MGWYSELTYQSPQNAVFKLRFNLRAKVRNANPALAIPEQRGYLTIGKVNASRVNTR